MFIIIGFSVILVVIILLAAIINYRAILKRKSYGKQLVDTAQSNDELYKKQYEYNHDLRKLKHDLNKYYDVFFAETSTDYSISESRVISKIISNAKATCEKEGISLFTDIDYDAYPEIDELELVGIMGNLISNAIEASTAYGKELKLSLKKDEGSIRLHIVNTKNPSIDVMKNGMKTTKADSHEHGLGSNIVDELLKKNKATIVRKDNKDTFDCEVIF